MPIEPYGCGRWLQPASASMLRLSSDGKTAAVVGGDGTVTIYDVASGKELMKFPGKK